MGAASPGQELHRFLVLLLSLSFFIFDLLEKFSICFEINMSPLLPYGIFGLTVVFIFVNPSIHP